MAVHDPQGEVERARGEENSQGIIADPSAEVEESWGQRDQSSSTYRQIVPSWHGLSSYEVCQENGDRRVEERRPAEKMGGQGHTSIGRPSILEVQQKVLIAARLRLPYCRVGVRLVSRTIRTGVH